MYSIFDVLNELDCYYNIVSDSCAASSYKKYYATKMIDLIKSYPEVEEFWQYYPNNYYWKDRFVKVKTPTPTEVKKLKKTSTLPTYYIYFAHHWNFGDSYSWQSVTEMKEYYTKNGRNAAEIKRICQQYLEAKIGLSATLEQRDEQLYNNEGLKIKRYFSFRGTYSQALWMESQIRLYIEQHYSSHNCDHFGNDHFHCMNTKIIKSIDKNFLAVCERYFQQMALVK